MSYLFSEDVRGYKVGGRVCCDFPPHFASTSSRSGNLSIATSAFVYIKTFNCFSATPEMALSFFPRAWICLRCQTKQLLPSKTFTTSAIQSVKQLPPRRQIDEADITEVFLCGSGPGGQKIVPLPSQPSHSTTLLMFPRTKQPAQSN